jgi:hypothetical protein
MKHSFFYVERKKEGDFGYSEIITAIMPRNITPDVAAGKW